MYHLYFGGETRGPYLMDQVKSMWASGIVTADALYWSETEGAWKPLMELFLASNPSSQARPSDEAVSRDPDYKAARAAKEAGKLIQKQNPDSSWASSASSLSYSALLSHARVLVERFPNSARAYRCLGDAYYCAGALEDALAAINKAIQIKPDDAISWHDLGGVQVNLKLFSEAETSFKRALQIAPDEPFILASFAGLQVEMGRKVDALRFNERAELVMRTKPFESYNGEILEESVWGRIAENSQSLLQTAKGESREAGGVAGPQRSAPTSENPPEPADGGRFQANLDDALDAAPAPRTMMKLLRAVFLYAVTGLIGIFFAFAFSVLAGMIWAPATIPVFLLLSMGWIWLGWKHASTLDGHKRDMAARLVPPQPGTRQASAQGDAPVAGASPGVWDASEPRPWRRLWARFLDYQILWAIPVTITTLVITRPIWPRLPFGGIPPIAIAYAFGALLEPIFLCKWGATPGKWLFGIKVCDAEGKKISLLNASRRFRSIFWRSLPLLLPFCAALAYLDLKKRGATKWDRKGGYTITYSQIGGGRWFASMSLVAVFAASCAVGISELNDRDREYTRTFSAISVPLATNENPPSAPASDKTVNATATTPEASQSLGMRSNEEPANVLEDTVKDPENTLYMDLKDGRVVIELLPNLAPKHVERVKLLTRQGFYNGTPFHRVIEGFMAQGGDPTGTGTGGSDLPNLPAEFSTTVPNTYNFDPAPQRNDDPAKHFVRGTVAAARTADPNSANSQFFIMFAPAPNLDGNYTVWGRVVKGMEFVDNIKRGEPPESPDKIVKMQVAADVTNN